jgi:hypothetical protein
MAAPEVEPAKLFQRSIKSVAIIKFVVPIGVDDDAGAQTFVVVRYPGPIRRLRKATALAGERME